MEAWLINGGGDRAACGTGLGDDENDDVDDVPLAARSRGGLQDGSLRRDGPSRGHDRNRLEVAIMTIPRWNQLLTVTQVGPLDKMESR